MCRTARGGVLSREGLLLLLLLLLLLVLYTIQPTTSVATAATATCSTRAIAEEYSINVIRTKYAVYTQETTWFLAGMYVTGTDDTEVTKAGGA